MVLKQEVVDAFAVLGLEPNVDQSVASTAYKKLALKHHPDRNYGDASAHERFQEIGQAWSICQRHYDYPVMSHVPEPGSRHTFSDFASGKTYSADDDVPLDEYEAAGFFRFMFHEMFANRFSYAKGQKYRSQRAGADGGGLYTFSGGFAESQERRAENAQRQKKEKEAYERRVREFEREQAEEQAEIARHARDAATEQARFASAQAHAFQLAKEGKGIEMRDLIEKFDLDVNKPRTCNARKNTKTAKAPQFETMLHAAAASCDVPLVDWLVNRGAEPAALNPSNLTPFHVAIACGNIPVARHFIFLYRNTKSTDPKYQSFCNGCHPSKATKGTTPLQLAIKSKNIDMVELLLNDATVHDVKRCWEQLDPEQRDSRLGDILLSKNGFTPDNNGSHQMLKKAARKLNQAEEEKKAYEAKERKLAQEEENRQAKQARRERAEKEEAERQERQEAERRRQLEEVEAEARKFQAEQEKASREAENRACREAEAREVSRQQEATKESKRRLKEKEAVAMQKAKEATARQKEMEAAAAATRRLKAEAEALQAAQREAELRRERERLKAEEQRMKQLEQEELRKQLERLKAHDKERIRLAKEQEEEAKRMQQEKEAEQARHDAVMRRRAEQSARDKARNQRLREERTKAKELEAALASPATSAPANSLPPTKIDQNILPVTKSSRKKPIPPHAATSGPPPVPVHTRPKLAPPQPPQPSYTYPVSTPLSPPMTPEDLQTIAIPEDLFQYEPPPESTNQGPLLSSPISNTTTVRGQKRGRGGRRIVREPTFGSETSESNHVGNGVRCRFFSRRGGCARGVQCAFSHNPVLRVRPTGPTALEEELARKNLELERVRAELAAARARAP